MYSAQQYLALEKKEIMSFVTTWMNMEGIMLSEINWLEKAKLHGITYMWSLKKKRRRKSG